jgi:hypothetical protein
MATQLDLPVFWNGIKRYRSYAPIASAAAILLLGAGVILALPNSDKRSNSATAIAEQSNTTTTAAETAGSANVSQNTEADDSACDKQAWPYVDQRCAQRVEKARGTRQVRIVTDKGNSVTVMTPVPVVEAKPKPAPAPVVAQAERTMGPAAVPPVPEGAPPIEQAASASPPVKAAPQSGKTETVVAAPTPAPAPKSAPVIAEAKPSVAEAKPTVQAAVATTDPQPTEAFERNPAQPVAKSAPSQSLGAQAFDQDQTRKSKAERKLEKRDAKREAKRRKMMDDGNGVPEEVIATVKNIKRSRQSAQAVPDDVISAVEEATGGSRRGRVVYIERGW